VIALQVSPEMTVDALKIARILIIAQAKAHVTVTAHVLVIAAGREI
jgi:hypothetical protein